MSDEKKCPHWANGVQRADCLTCGPADALAAKDAEIARLTAERDALKAKYEAEQIDAIRVAVQWEQRATAAEKQRDSAQLGFEREKEARQAAESALSAVREVLETKDAALRQIERPRVGLEMNSTAEEQAEYWSGLALEYRAIARAALAAATGDGAKRCANPWHKHIPCSASSERCYDLAAPASERREATHLAVCADAACPGCMSRPTPPPDTVSRAEVLRIIREQPNAEGTHTGTRQQWVRDEIARKVEALDGAGILVPPELAEKVLRAFRYGDTDEESAAFTEVAILIDKARNESP